MIFKWSRIRSARDHSDMSEVRLRNLYFEDFIEALVRVCTTIALPTDAEVTESGLADGGEYLRVLRTSDKEFQRYVSKQKTGWSREPRQAVQRCIAHLMSYLVRVFEGNTSRVKHGKADMVLSPATHTACTALAVHLPSVRC